jgi:hypothetical protein
VPASLAQSKVAIDDFTKNHTKTLLRKIIDKPQYCTLLTEKGHLEAG